MSNEQVGVVQARCLPEGTQYCRESIPCVPRACGEEENETAMGTIDEELLEPNGMATVRARLTARYPWFLHIKPAWMFDSIKKHGFRPASQGCPTNPIVASAIGGAVGNVDEMIFLRPLGTFDSTPRRGEKLFAMAISRDELPSIMTVDWTFAGTGASPTSSRTICPSSQTRRSSARWSAGAARLRFTKAFLPTFYASGRQASRRTILQLGPGWPIPTLPI